MEKSWYKKVLAFVPVVGLITLIKDLLAKRVNIKSSKTIALLLWNILLIVVILAGIYIQFIRKPANNDKLNKNRAASLATVADPLSGKQLAEFTCLSKAEISTLGEKSGIKPVVVPVQGQENQYAYNVVFTKDNVVAKDAMSADNLKKLDELGSFDAANKLRNYQLQISGVIEEGLSKEQKAAATKAVQERVKRTTERLVEKGSSKLRFRPLPTLELKKSIVSDDQKSKLDEFYKTIYLRVLIPNECAVASTK